MRSWTPALTAFPAALMLLLAVAPGLADAIEPGDYYLVARHSYKALTAFEGDAGEVVLGQSARSDDLDGAQIWTIAPAAGNAGTGSYTIHSRRYATALSVGDANDNGDASVVLSEAPTAKTPVWRFNKRQNSYDVEAGRSGATLNVTGGALANDAEIIVYDASADDNAQWILYPARAQAAPAERVWDASEIDNADRLYRLIALPPAAQEADRLRQMKLMDYQPSGIHARKGEKIAVQVRGLSSSADGLTILVGPMNSYEGGTERSNPQMIVAHEGANEFTAERNGMIYFLYLDSGFNAVALPPIEIEITRGGTVIPLFISGQTTPDEWQAMLSDYPADSFVEMMNGSVLITATRKVFDHARQDAPEEILGTLQKILSWYDELSGLDGSSPLHAASRLRLHYQQDLVSSKQALDGIYMYAADYFVGVPGENMGDLLVLQKLRHAWSIWHETGHKYQQTDWTWEEVIETTVNIYSLEAQARLGYSSRLKERDADTGKSPLDLARRYLARKKRDFTDSSQMRLHPDDDGDYWVRLVMFDQLRQAFGKDFYPRLHRHYREHPLDNDQGKDQDAQIQAFVLASSSVAEQDLSRFFSDWGITLADDTRRSLAELGLPPADAALARSGLGK